LKLLLDTHALIWWTADAPDLPDRARDVIADPANEILVSVASFWEIAIKRALGKLEFPEDFETTLTEEGFALLPITFGHLRSLERLESKHRDPFDRMLVAQASADGLVVVTGDPTIGQHEVTVIW
jgi:PIN domain nuclease of toxin-antitoxin system